MTKLCCLTKCRGQEFDDMEAGENKNPKLTCIQRLKLKTFFQHIVSNAPIDNTNKEIHDIQHAVETMLERIQSRVNRRGIFNITSVVGTGSMADHTSLWKCNIHRLNEQYLEFDFLAKLENTIIQCINQSAEHDCRGCIKLVKPPVELERLRQYYKIDDENGKSFRDIRKTSNLFLNEINLCLTSSCDCLSFQGNKIGFYSISLRSSSEHKQGCEECTIDMPTGALHVNTDIDINQGSCGPNNCSLIFVWRSKTMTLSAPGRLLLQKPQPISSLPIRVDFLPALESLRPSTSGAGEEHEYFVVPKRCNVCDERCRMSWCMAEINALTKEMSDKHRKCFQIIKYLSQALWFAKIPGYDLKTIALRHHTTCTDVSDDCVDCVMEMFFALNHAYKIKELLSYQSNLNILTVANSMYFEMMGSKWIINKLCSVSVTDTWETFVRKISEMPSETIGLLEHDT